MNERIDFSFNTIWFLKVLEEPKLQENFDFPVATSI